MARETLSLAVGDWSVVRGSAIISLSNGRLLFDFTNTSATNNVVLNNVIPVAGDVDVLAILDRPADSDHIAALWLGGDGTGNNGYMGGLRNNASDMTIREMLNGSLTTHQNAPHGLPAGFGKVWVRFQRVGNDLRLSVWEVDEADASLGAHNEPEPITVMDDTHGAGKVGLTFVLTATPNRTVYMDFLSYGTGGDTAPRPGETVGGGTGADGRTPEMRSIPVAEGIEVQWKYTDEPDTAWRSLGTVFDGVDGDDGRTPMMRTSGGVVQWKYVSEPDTAWRDLFTVPTGTGTGDGRTPELRVDGDFLQWKYTDETAWTNLYDMLTLVGPQGDPGPAPEMRESNGFVEWKRDNETTWKQLYEIGSGGGGTTINVIGRHVSNKQMGIEATSDPVLGRQRFQEFVDNCASDKVTGFIDASYWAIDGTVDLHDGLRLVGRGMHLTTIDCPSSAWSQSGDFIALILDVGGTLHKNGLYLADFGVVGADKSRQDDRPLIRLEGLEDGVVERLRVEDASSYGIYVTGYGLGSYVNEIDDPHWNNTYRVTVRDCLALRGQIGFGTEGGAKDVLFKTNVAIGDTDGSLGGLHGFRSASGRNIAYVGNRVYGYRNGFLLDRYENVLVNHNHLQRVRNGVSVGSYYSSDPRDSFDVRITNNYFDCNLADGRGKTAVNDTYISNREVNGLTIADNHVMEGSISLSNAKRASVHGNIDLTGGGNDINIGSGVTGAVNDNLMDVSNSSSNVRTNNNGAV